MRTAHLWLARLAHMEAARLRIHDNSIISINATLKEHKSNATGLKQWQQQHRTLQQQELGSSR
jgi:hypothetical protein